MAWGVYAIWFSVTHVRTSYARVSGYMVTLSAKDDTRLQKLLVRTGDRVHKGQALASLDNADIDAEVDQARASLQAKESALNRAEADLELTIRQTAASIEEAEAQLSASRARLSQAERTQPDQVRRARAELAAARARLAQLEAGARPQEVEQVKADLASAESQLASATATLRRNEKLQKEGAVSAQALDTARTEQEVAQSGVASARQKLSLVQAGSRAEDIEAARQAVASAEAALSVAIAQSPVDTLAAESRQYQAGLKAAQSQQRNVALKEQDVLSQRAAVAEARAALEAVKARLSYTELRSTENGIVLPPKGQTLHEGEVVTKGLPIMTIVSTDDPFWITASVSELLVSRVKEGQSAIITIDAFKRRTFPGRVTQVGGATEMTADDTPWSLKQVPVKLSLDPDSVKDVKEQLKPGMSCRVWIDVRK
jgi:multidrug resistance efflux pump